MCIWPILLVGVGEALGDVLEHGPEHFAGSLVFEGGAQNLYALNVRGGDHGGGAGASQQERHFADEIAFAEAGQVLLLIGGVALHDVDGAAADNQQRGANIAFALNHGAVDVLLQLNPAGDLVEVVAIDVREERCLDENIFDGFRHRGLLRAGASRARGHKIGIGRRLLQTRSACWRRRLNGS